MKKQLNREFDGSQCVHFFGSTSIKKSLVLLVINCIILAGCVKIDEPNLQTAEDIVSYCPTCADNITWGSYGGWQFTGLLNSANEGELSDGFSFNIEENCNWSVIEDTQDEWEDVLNNGGYFLTSSECRNGVIFEWNQLLSTSSVANLRRTGFHAFYLSDGWEGSTPEGIKIGSNLAEFLNTYPEFDQSSSDDLRYRDFIDGSSVIAQFDEKKRLKYLKIER